MPDSTKLRFILLLPEASTKGEFILKDLPGSGKRIDLLCRVFSAGFDWAPNTFDKSNIEIIAVIDDSVILLVQYPGKDLPIGEKAWALIIKNSLQGDPPHYVQVIGDNLESVILKFNNPPTANFWVLHEEGEEVDLREAVTSSTDNSFMLGDHRGFNSHAEDLVSKYDLQKISLGKTSYLSSHCVALIISRLERKDK
jgi:tRNA (pseudouridine54-N1)-methyltransferase